MRIQHLLHLLEPRRDLVETGLPPVVLNYASRLLWAIWAFTVVSAAFLALRVYCKLSRGRSLWWDDHFLIASWFTILVSSALLTAGTKYGIGMHFEDMDYENMPAVAWISIAAGFSTLLGTTWSKTSFAITLLRLSSSRWMRWLIWFIIISVNLVLGFAAAVMWIQCWPVSKLWIYDLPGSCWPAHVVQSYMTFGSAYSGALDILLSLLPWKIVWNVAINKKEKIGALIAMSMGVFSGIISFLKIISLDDISDSSSTTVDVKIFGTAEPAVTIIAVALPVLRAFVRRDAKPKSQSIQFIQFSQIPEPTSGLSVSSSYEKKHAGGFDDGLVMHVSRPSQASLPRRDTEF